MRRNRIRMAGLLVLWCTAPAAADDGWLRQPVVQPVLVGRAAVYSGPTEDDYVVGHVLRGTNVEIFRRTDDGWLAIRPPADAFSWIEATAATPLGDGQYRIVRDGTISWIGSRGDSPAQFRWQVRLNANEIVSAFSPQALTEHPARPDIQWLRIQPPSGEFRWIRAEAMEEARPAGAATATEQPSDSAITAAVLHREGEPDEQVAAVAWKEAAAVRRDAAKQPKRPPATVRHAASVEPVGWSSRNWSAERTRLEADLALEVAQPAEQWELEPLDRRARRLIASAPSDRAREQVEHLAVRIERFVEWRSRRAYDRLRRAAGQRIAAAPAVAAEVGASRLPLSGKPDRAEVDFDGRGWLETVHSRRADAPRFALLDDDGKILAFVVPSPGLRLHRYVKQRIGVYGKRLPERGQNPPWITTRRVVKLD